MSLKSLSPFDNDVKKFGGYQYTTHAPLSCTFANSRLTKATLEFGEFTSKKVVDFGCGDGVYSAFIFNKTRPTFMLGVDIAAKAIDNANNKYSENNLEFKQINLESPPKWFQSKKFEIGIARGLIHHFDHPHLFFKNALINVEELILLEPNGYNPILKIIEKTSSYHIAHNEKSYTSVQLKSWLQSVGFTITQEKYIGIVPFFCPNWMAIILKKCESFFESLPIIRKYLCAVVVIKAQK